MLRSNEFYTTKELAQELRVTEMTIYRLVKKGKLPCVSFGRLKRFRKKDVLNFLNQLQPDSNRFVLNEESDSINQEDRAWLDSDLSNLSGYGQYEWKPREFEKGKSIQFVPGKGFLIQE